MGLLVVEVAAIDKHSILRYGVKERVFFNIVRSKFVCFSVLYTAQPVFHNQVVPPDVLTAVTIEKYMAELVHNKNCTNFAENLLNRIECSNQTNLLCHILYNSP
jgi:hypothetical protein